MQGFSKNFDIATFTRGARASHQRFLLVLISFAFLIKAEGIQYSVSDFCYHSNTAEVELVISTQTTCQFGTAVDQIAYEDIQCRRHSEIHRRLLFRYDELVRHQLRTYLCNHKNNPPLRCTQFLQMQNIWHQSADDVPHLSC